MAISTHALSQIRQYSTRVPRDPRYRLKATLATTYVVSALALPFVPPLLETRRAKADGSYLTRAGRDTGLGKKELDNE
ncbi:unnamed protein product [Alternaria alternata]